MKKITFIIALTITCFLLASLISYAQIVVDITGLRTMCPTDYFKTLHKGSRTLCIQKDPRVVAVTLVNRVGCPSGYNKRSYAGAATWCIKTTGNLY